jgi:hypothetical protein
MLLSVAVLQGRKFIFTPELGGAVSKYPRAGRSHEETLIIIF